MVALVRWHEWVWRELGSQERNGGRGRAIRFLIETFAYTECSIFERLYMVVSCKKHPIFSQRLYIGSILFSFSFPFRLLTP